MLIQEQLSRICIVLVRARNPNNIGAVARAMHDFGFSDLRIVNEYTMPLEGARSAVDASSVLLGATAYATVADAVAGCSLVAGTTAAGARVLEHPLLSLSEAAPKLLEALGRPTAEVASPQFTEAAATTVAILFGSEKTGLSNDELSHCNWLLTIPMYQHDGSRHLSMNLGQAVAVCLYELVREQPGRELLDSRDSFAKSATATEQERMVKILAEVLEVTEYTRHHPANSALADLRRLVLRMKLSSTDASVWMGILRQILWKLRN